MYLCFLCLGVYYNEHLLLCFVVVLLLCRGSCAVFYVRRSHKDEVKAVLASEPGLVEEIDFDLRRFEKDEHERRQKAKV